MQVYHLGNSKYARQLSGEGARLFGGRWNQTGDACIYTSSTRSLCVLEYLANVRMEDMPPSLSITVYEVPDNLCRKINYEELPEDWNAIPPAGSQPFGSALLQENEYACFAVPSVVVPAEWNYILNPNANSFAQIKIVAVEPFSLDQRI